MPDVLSSSTESRSADSDAASSGGGADDRVREQFVDESLGKHSSHPHHASRRAAFWRRVGHGIGFLGIAFAGWYVVRGFMKILDANSTTQMIGSGASAIYGVFSASKFIFPAFAFGLCFALTSALSIRMSRLGQATRAAPSTIVPRPVAVLCAVGMLGAACFVMAWLATTKDVEFLKRNRWFTICLACIPLECILLWSAWSSRDEDRGPVWWAVKTFVQQVLFLSAMAAGVIVTTSTLQDSVGKWTAGLIRNSGILSMLSGWFPQLGAISSVLERAIAGKLGVWLASFTQVLATFTSGVLLVWVTSRVSSVSDDASREFRRQDRPGCLASMFRWIDPRSWFRKATKETLGDTMASTPASGTSNWSVRLAEHLRSKGIRAKVSVIPAVTPERGGRADAFSPPSEETEYSWLFGGERPTADQVAALKRFMELGSTLDRRRSTQDHRATSELHADLLVQGFPESFTGLRSNVVLEFQLACAVLTLVQRGQRVLILALDEDERDRLIDHVRSRLEAMRLETLYRVDSLDAQSVGRWCPPAAAPSSPVEGQPPDVLIATVLEYERACFGGASSDLVIKGLLLSTQLVILPNLEALSRIRIGQLHLPFVIDKHRLLLASEHRTLQVVMGSPPLAARSIESREEAVDSGEQSCRALEWVARRFFGGDGTLAGHVIRLRQRREPRPELLQIQVAPADVVRTSVQIAQLFLEGAHRGADAVLLPSREQPPLSREDLKLLRGKDSRLTVLPESDATSDDLLKDAISGRSRLICMGRESSPWVGRILSAMSPTEQMLIEITMARRSAAVVPPPAWKVALPVFVSPRATSFALAHLRAATFHLAADTMIRRDEFARFGLSWDGVSWSADHRHVILHEGWSLELDGDLGDLLDQGASTGQIWPAVILRRASRSARPVDVFEPVPGGMAFHGSSSLVLAQLPAAGDQGRIATWIAPRGAMLGSADLSLGAELIWRGERATYRASRVSETDGRWIVIGEPITDSRDEPTVPVLALTVDIPTHAVLDRLPLVDGGGMRMVGLRAAPDGEAIRCDQAITAVAPSQVASGTDGAEVSAPRRGTPIGPISFSTDCVVTLVGFGRRDWLDAFIPPNADPMVLRGSWSTTPGAMPERTFSPRMTLAFQEALMDIAPSLLDFGRVLCFRQRDRPDGVALVLVEPSSTSGTASEALQCVLDDVHLRRRLGAKLMESIARRFWRELPRAPLYDVLVAGGDPAAEEAARLEDLEWARSVVRVLPCGALSAEPGGTVVNQDESAASARVDPPALVDTQANEKDHQWTLQLGNSSVKLSVEIGITEKLADLHSAAFGYHPDTKNHEQFAACGFKVTEGNWLSIDYEWMIRKSLQDVAPLAERLAAVATAAGATDLRSRVEVFASFVQSFRYVMQAEGRLRDGKKRAGVQMPVETLFTKCGDCDSLSALLIALLRAGRVAPAAMVLIDEDDGGHAMASVAIDPRAKRDWGFNASGDGGAHRFALIESTAAGWRIGDTADEYKGRYVRIEASDKP